MISRAVDFDWQKLTMPFTDSLQYFCLSWFTLVVVAATQLDSVITKSASDICQAPICYLGEYCSQLLPKCANVKPVCHAIF